MSGWCSREFREVFRSLRKFLGNYEKIQDFREVFSMIGICFAGFETNVLVCREDLQEFGGPPRNLANVSGISNKSNRLNKSPENLNQFSEEVSYKFLKT